MFRIQHQTWHKLERYVISSAAATVQLEVYAEPKDEVDCYIFALWVNKSHRKRGYGYRALREAENVARTIGKKAVYLEWSALDTPQWVLDWYTRNGYEERAWKGEGDNLQILLKKTL